MPLKQKFQEGEKVLCYHGPLMYEAKCLKVDPGERNIKYFMHYAGWNKSWDEWVNEDRIMKYNDVGLQRQKELKLAHANKRRSAPMSKKEVGKEKEKDRDKEKEREKEKTPKERKEKEKKEMEKTLEDERRDKKDKDKKEKKEKDSRKHRASTDVGEPPRKTRARDSLATGESIDIESGKGEMKIQVPAELKTVLADDWDYVTRQSMLHQLPARKTAQSVLDDYVDFKLKSSKDTFVRDMAEELALAVRDYFNTILGTQLLYKSERLQYQDMKAEHCKQPLSDVYGGVHLLRVFVKLGGVISYSNLDEKSWFFIASHIQDLLRYIVKNRQSIFSKDDYTPATPDNLKRIL